MPVAGGWYDQHPDFVDAVEIYFDMKGEYEEKKRKEEERERDAEMRKMKSRR